MIELSKDPYSQDTYGYYDQYGNRYLFLSKKELNDFLTKQLIEYFIRGNNDNSLRMSP